MRETFTWALETKLLINDRNRDGAVDSINYTLSALRKLAVIMKVNQ